MTFADLIVTLIIAILCMVVGAAIGMLVLNENIKQTCPELHEKWMLASTRKEDAHAAD